MRIEKSLALPASLSVEVLVIDNPIDIFYLTGQSFSLARLILSQKRGACLLVDGRYIAKAKQSLSFEVALSGKGVLGEKLHGAKKVGFDSAFTSVEGVEALKKIAKDVVWTPISNPLRSMRICKDATEIFALKKAAALTMAGCKKIFESLKEGVSEAELAWEFEVFCRTHGASGLSFPPIIAFGENSAFPHHRSSDTRLKKNQTVLFDLGAIVDHYCGDMTRVFFFGEPDAKIFKLYTLAKAAHDRAAAIARPGVKIGDLDLVVREFFSQEGVEALFSHGLGHGVGIEVHEPPTVRLDGADRDVPLATGMVFTIEPGLYLPGVGGVRYENTFAVIDGGIENFYV